MRIDLLAGTVYHPLAMPPHVPTILVFDSGLGGLTVYSELVKARPDARFVYAADDAAFPYGRLSEAELVARVLAVMEMLVDTYAPEIAVIACNTASTLVLAHLRARFSIPFVGTVPAIKPGAARSASRMISVLATPGTVARDYTQDLVRTYARDCAVALVGSTRLAAMAEAELAGSPASDADILAEIAPCFCEAPDGRRTDTVVLACTHYPLLLHRLERLAPWPVTFVDPAPAIARRMVDLIGAPLIGHEGEEEACAVFTGTGASDRLKAALAARGFSRIDTGALALAVA